MDFFGCDHPNAGMYFKDFSELTWLNSSSPSGLKCQSTVARAKTSSRLLQEMQPSRNPPPATASVRESTSAQPPWQWDTAGKREGRQRREQEEEQKEEEDKDTGVEKNK